MGQWMLNLLYIVRDPLVIESMSFEQMRWWNQRAEKIVEAEKRALGGGGA